MMKHFGLAAAALVGLEAAALACSCLATDDPAELRRLASDAAQNAIAVVEAEALTSFEATRSGEKMRVTRIIAGNAPVHFTIHREASASSASCDMLYKVGDRAVMVLYPASGLAVAPATYSISGLCTVHLLDKAVFLDTLVKVIGGPIGERG